MQREILSPLAEILLGGDAISGSTINVDATPLEAQVEGSSDEQAPQEMIFSLTHPHESEASHMEEPSNSIPEEVAL